VLCRSTRVFRLRFGLTCIALLLMYFNQARAQEYGFDTWTTANGLPQNTVTGLVQTPDGYLWLSTFDGLARFDGVRFVIFDESNSKGIVNNRFSNLFVDKHGTLFTFTDNNFLTVYRDGVFSSYSATEALHEPVASLVSDADGEALIETDSAFYSFNNGSFVRSPEQKQRGVRQVFFAKSGTKWGFEQNTVSQFKAGQVIQYRFSLSPVDLGFSLSLTSYEDSQGALWIFTSDAKLRRLDKGVISVFGENEHGMSKDFVIRPFADELGSVWFIATGSRTLRPNKLLRFQNDHFASFDFSEAFNAIKGIKDSEGGLWLATTSGLKRFRRQLITSLTVKDGLNSNSIYPLFQKRNGEILIGGDQGVNLYANGKMTDLGLTYSDGGALYVRGLWEDDQSRLWFGYQRGFGRLENGSVKDLNEVVIPGGASDFCSDKSGNVWIATTDGLFKYKDDKEVAHYTSKDGLPNDNIITIRTDRNGSLWIGTFDGLAQLKDGTVTNYKNVAESPKGYVRAIYEDDAGVLWFGTYGDGLVRYADGKFFKYRVEQGLFNNGVFAIMEDKRGNFWMSCNRGIHRVSKQELTDLAAGRIAKLNSVSYDQSDGMPNAECNGGRMPSAIKTQAGKFWFPTMGGVTIIDPEAESINPNPPPVVIETVEIDRQPIASDALLSSIRNSQSSIELNPGQSQLEITYTGLSLIKSEQTKFRYKLEGLEANWVEAGTKRTANYSYLPAGSYTFHVIAANANGVWNNHGTLVRIIVRPHFYQTWWFVLLAVLTGGGIVSLVYYSRVSRLKEIAKTKTAFSRQLIESQEAERKRIAAELHDGLGQNLVIIKNRAVLGINKGDDPDRVARELGSISESASQALDEVREITNNLRPQLLDRLGLTKAISAMIKKVSGVIEVSGDLDPVDDLFAENEEISIYRIVQESLNNAIKHSGASQVRVNIKRTDTRVLISIADDGKGFDVDASDRSGLGLVGLKERAHFLSGTFIINSSIGAGTRIEVEIPIHQPRK